MKVISRLQKVEGHLFAHKEATEYLFRRTISALSTMNYSGVVTDFEADVYIENERDRYALTMLFESLNEIDLWISLNQGSKPDINFLNYRQELFDAMFDICDNHYFGYFSDDNISKIKEALTVCDVDSKVELNVSREDQFGVTLLDLARRVEDGNTDVAQRTKERWAELIRYRKKSGDSSISQIGVSANHKSRHVYEPQELIGFLEKYDPDFKVYKSRIRSNIKALMVQVASS